MQLRSAGIDLSLVNVNAENDDFLTDHQNTENITTMANISHGNRSSYSIAIATV